MKAAFTDYIRSLDPGSDPPSPERFGEFWLALRATLKREIQHRGLWGVPPLYVGLDATDVWSEEALEELTADCYIFLFARLRSLKLQLKAKPNIDGLIVLNIRHFLHERQKRHDPLGFRVFEALRCAVRDSVAAGVLRVLEGDPGISNRTLLGSARCAGNSVGSDPTNSGLQRVVRGWIGELMPHLVLARGRRRQQVIGRLCSNLDQLGGAGVLSFRLKEVADALKRAARVEWQAFWVHEQGDTAIEEEDGSVQFIVSSVRADISYEQRESFFKLLDYVTQALGELPAAEGPGDHLTTLWQFLRTQAQDPSVDVLPSRRRIAEALGIPRHRLPGYFATLGQLVEEFLENYGMPLSTDLRRPDSRAYLSWRLS